MAVFMAFKQLLFTPKNRIPLPSPFVEPPFPRSQGASRSLVFMEKPEVNILQL